MEIVLKLTGPASKILIYLSKSEEHKQIQFTSRLTPPFKSIIENGAAWISTQKFTKRKTTKEKTDIVWKLYVLVIWNWKKNIWGAQRFA